MLVEVTYAALGLAHTKLLCNHCSSLFTSLLAGCHTQDDLGSYGLKTVFTRAKRNFYNVKPLGFGGLYIMKASITLTKNTLKP